MVDCAVFVVRIWLNRETGEHVNIGSLHLALNPTHASFHCVPHYLMKWKRSEIVGFHSKSSHFASLGEFNTLCKRWVHLLARDDSPNTIMQKRRMLRGHVTQFTAALIRTDSPESRRSNRMHAAALFAHRK